MNITMSPEGLTNLVLLNRYAAAGFESVEACRLGMPHLSLASLSETWLLKELGHRHWQLLARMAGKPLPDFRDIDGKPVYAAFRAVSLRDVALGGFVEHDELLVQSRITRLSRTQFVSIHALSRNGVPAGEVELCSIFVKRHVDGRNRSIARIALEGFAPVDPDPPIFTTAQMASAFGTDRWQYHMGFDKREATAGHRFTLNPCPSQDFNGADFLYFACFQAFIDRAEWDLLGQAGASLTTAARDIVYHGNIEIGDRIAVIFQGLRAEPGGITHWCRIHRAQDQALLADVFTRRVFA